MTKLPSPCKTALNRRSLLVSPSGFESVLRHAPFDKTSSFAPSSTDRAAAICTTTSLLIAAKTTLLLIIGQHVRIPSCTTCLRLVGRGRDTRGAYECISFFLMCFSYKKGPAIVIRVFHNRE